MRGGGGGEDSEVLKLLTSVTVYNYAPSCSLSQDVLLLPKGINNHTRTTHIL